MTFLKGWPVHLDEPQTLYEKATFSDWPYFGERIQMELDKKNIVSAQVLLERVKLIKNTGLKNYVANKWD